MEYRKGIIPIALICDDNYVMPTCVTVSSIVQEKCQDTLYDFYIICASLTEANEQIFHRFDRDDVIIHIIRQDASRFEQLHTFQNGTFCVATPAALLKFVLPELIDKYAKVLYLDGDIIVREDLSKLYNTELGDAYLAAVVDSGSIYVKNTYIQSVKDYFNSGVMLLNLEQMRKDNLPQTLIQTKMEMTDSNMMDQNVFNVVCDGRMLPLPIRYNFLPVNLVRARGKWTLGQINKRYGTDYANEAALFHDAAIIHFSSKDKPWKNSEVCFADDWYRCYLNAPIEHSIVRGETEHAADDRPKVSVIIPVYNVEAYLDECLNSVLKQTLREIEVICIDDGSTDGSSEILRRFSQQDSRLKYQTQKNSGQGVARNVGVSLSNGEYLYFMDSDDVLESEALQRCYEVAQWSVLDLVLFEGSSFFETPELEIQHGNYKTLYQRKGVYPEIYDGQALYCLLAGNWDFIISPAMRFYRRDLLIDNGIRFPENIKLEDNFFAFQSLVCAKRVKVLPDALYRRRVRENSTMTDQNDYSKYVGYHTTACMAMKYIGTHELKELTIRAAALHICQWLKSANDYYVKLPDERKEFSKTDPNVPILEYSLLEPLLNLNKSDFLRYYCHGNGISPLVIECDSLKQKNWMLNRDISRLQEENRNLKKELAEAKGNRSRLRQLFCGGIRCLKEHGIRYTIRRFAQKVENKLRRGIQCYREHGFIYTLKRTLHIFF